MSCCINHPNREVIYQDEEWCLECYQDYFLDEEPQFSETLKEIKEEYSFS